MLDYQHVVEMVLYMKTGSIYVIRARKVRGATVALLSRFVYYGIWRMVDISPREFRLVPAYGSDPDKLRQNDQDFSARIPHAGGCCHLYLHHYATDIRVSFSSNPQSIKKPKPDATAPHTVRPSPSNNSHPSRHRCPKTPDSPPAAPQPASAWP